MKLLSNCLVATALTAALTGGAYAQKVAPPPLGKPRPLVLPKSYTATLDNGLRLVVLEDHSQPAVWIRLAVPGGSVRDGGKAGLASMTAALLKQGTKTRTSEQISRTLDTLGASVGASTDADYLTVSASGLSSQSQTLFALVADVTVNPTFPDTEVDRYKARLIPQLGAALADAATVANASLARVVYGAHPYGNPAQGTPQSVGAINAGDLRDFHNTYFAPNASTLFVQGDITPAQAQALARQAFAGWTRRDVPAAPSAPTAMAATSGKPQVVIIDRPGAAQTEVRIGALAGSYRDPQRIASQAATAVLGVGQFSGRLMQEIRVKRGLTYGAGSNFSRNKDAGEFYITTFTKTASTGEVVGLALGELEKLRQAPVSAEELRERKNLFTGSYSMTVASPTALLTRLQTAILYGNGPDDLTQYIGRMDAVTPADVQGVLSGLRLDQASIVLVGDAQAIAPQVEQYGTVTIIPATSLDLLSPTLRGAQTASPAAATAPAGASTADGKALLAATVKAHGGDAFVNLQSLKAKGKGELSPPGQGLKVSVTGLTLYAVSPDKARLDLETADLGAITIASPGEGSKLWFSTGFGGVQDLPFAGNLGDPTAVLRAAVKNNYAVTTAPVGATLPNAASLQAFTVTDGKGVATTFFTDSKTNLVSRVTSKQGPASLEFVLSDYKTVDGVVTPSHLVTNLNGQELINVTLSGFEINKPVAGTLFVRPKE